MSGGLRVVGLDLSLTSTGMSDGRRTEVVQTSPDQCLEERLHTVLCSVSAFIAGADPFERYADLAVIEAGAFSRGAQSQAAEILSALRFMVRHLTWSFNVPFAMVSPSCLKAYTTGYGCATKQQVVTAVDNRHAQRFGSTVRVKDGRYDMADAYALAAMGYDRMGQRLAVHFPGLPPHRASLDAVLWPDLT